MPDKVQKSFVRSFISYLKNQIEDQALSADALESVEVAVQCLQAAFEISEEQETPATSESNAAATASSSETTSSASTQVDLFEMFQSLYIDRSPQFLEMAEDIKNEGNRLMKEGKYNEALLQYNRAITFDPKNPIFYCNRAAAYIRLGDSDRAIADCKSALVYNPSYGKAYGRLGIAYSNLGKFEEAQQAYLKAIELEPDNQDYRSNLEVARNARSQLPPGLNQFGDLSEGINNLLSNPAIRNLFNAAQIDMTQIQNLSQSPILQELFTAAAGGGNVNSQDLLGLFQTFATRLATQGDFGADGDTNGGQQQQPPPSS